MAGEWEQRDLRERKTAHTQHPTSNLQGFGLSDSAPRKCDSVQARNVFSTGEAARDEPPAGLEGCGLQTGIVSGSTQRMPGLTGILHRAMLAPTEIWRRQPNLI